MVKVIDCIMSSLDLLLIPVREILLLDRVLENLQKPFPRGRKKEKKYSGAGSRTRIAAVLSI